MKTEITPSKLKTWFFPTKEFQRADGTVVDYAEIEINPRGIRKLEERLDRCRRNPRDYAEKEWADMNDPDSELYERVIAYVHFKTGTEEFDCLLINITTPLRSSSLDASGLVNDEERQNIIDAALASIRKGVWA